MTIRKPARLLLVDDDPGLLKLLGMRLVSRKRCACWGVRKWIW